LVCLLFLLPVHAAERSDFSAWFVDSLVKVFPDTPAATSNLELALVSPAIAIRVCRSRCGPIHTEWHGCGSLLRA